MTRQKKQKNIQFAELARLVLSKDGNLGLCHKSQKTTSKGDIKFLTF